MNWIQRFLAAITTHKADVSAHHAKYTDADVLLVAAALIHAARHEDTGADEISVAGLAGLLADDQHVLDAEVLLVAAALVHAARHENAGADEISVAGLAGLLANDQHVLDAEVLAVAAALVHAHAAGDVTSGQFGLNRMPRAASGVLTGKGAGVNPAYEAAGAGPTKEFFVPVTFGDVMEYYYWHPGALVDFAGGNECMIEFYVPHDFSSIIEAKVMRIAKATGTHRLNYSTDYGAVGEGSWQHEESVTDQDTAEADANIYEQDISSALSVLAAGDYCGIRVYPDSVNPCNDHIVGVRLKYS